MNFNILFQTNFEHFYDSDKNNYTISHRKIITQLAIYHNISQVVCKTTMIPSEASNS